MLKKKDESEKLQEGGLMGIVRKGACVEDERCRIGRVVGGY